MSEEFGSSEAGKKGGKARAKALTAEERKEIARQAAIIRWQKQPDEDGLPKAICGSDEQPLIIGETRIQCYVLDDEQRVISQRGLKAGIGMNATGGARRLTKFASSLGLKPEITNDLAVRINNPIRFRMHSGGSAHGYEATLLADLCDAVLDARARGTLNRQQSHIADQCEILVRGFARVGIIALVDEATGYQHFRPRRALAEILEKYISDKFLDWAKRFPDDFYIEMFRLKGWDYDSLKPGSKKPSVVGKYTWDIVYQRLAPGVIEELERVNPAVRPGQRQVKHHQWLTEDIGHAELREHLAKVITVMKLSNDWGDFKKNLRKVLPKKWEQTEFADLFPDQDD